MRTPASSDLAILTRLELARLRAFWRSASRDLLFDLCLLILVAIAGAGSRTTFAAALREPPALAIAAALGLGAMIFLAVHAGSRRVVDTLTSGPFQALVAEPRQLQRWRIARAGAYAVGALLALALVLASLAPVKVAVFLPTALLGVLAAAGGVLTIGFETRPRPAVAVVRRAPRLRSHRGVLIPALSTLRQGRWAVAIGLVFLGAVATSLAGRNNSSPVVAEAIAALAAIVAGGALFPRARIAGLLGQQPPSLARLYAWLYAPAVCAGAFAGALIGMAGGLGGPTAIELAVTAAVGLTIVSWFVFLHRLIRSERNTLLAASLDFAAAFGLAVVQGSLGPIWLAARGLLLAPIAGRRRWLDR